MVFVYADSKGFFDVSLKSVHGFLCDLDYFFYFFLNFPIPFLSFVMSFAQCVPTTEAEGLPISQNQQNSGSDQGGASSRLFVLF